MKEITRYEANDGTIFTTEEECLEYERMQDIVVHLRDIIYRRKTDADEVVKVLLQYYTIIPKE